MKFLPAIVAALAVVALTRLRRRRRRAPADSTGGDAAPRAWTLHRRAKWRGRAPFGDTGLIAGREIRERVRGRVFRAVTAVLFLVVAAAVVIPTLHRSSATTQRVGVVAATPTLDAELGHLAKASGLSVALVPERSLAAGRAAVSAGRVAMVVDAAKIVVANPVAAGATSATARFLDAVATTLGAQRAIARAGLTPPQAAIIQGARPLPVESLHAGKPARTTAEATALLGVILIFIVLTQYLTWTLMGVMEEKASRVVEVLLATVRPVQLLAGKVLGIGAVAMAQAIALVAFALALGAAVGSSLVHGAAPAVVVSTLVWLVLGYAFYSWVYAAAGSLVERQDQVQSMALPLSAPLVIGYIVSLVGVSSGHASLLVEVLAYLPPTAPFAMPALVGFGQAAWWQFALSVVASLVATVLVALLAARVYRAAVLQTGGRVRVRQLVRAKVP